MFNPFSQSDDAASKKRRPSTPTTEAETGPAVGSEANAMAKTSSVSMSSSGMSSSEAAVGTPSTEALAIIERPMPSLSAKPASAKSASAKASRRQLPKNFLLKRLDVLYWKRLLRYLYIRFLRMQGSPEAIARGVAAGVFAGSFPLLGFQTLIGIAIASVVRGNKIMAAVGTWVSNPLTYFPIFALNFHVGRLLMRLPETTVIPSSLAGANEWMSLGMSVTSALLVGSCVVGMLAAVVGYYVGLLVAHRVRSARRR